VPVQYSTLAEDARRRKGVTALGEWQQLSD
jgi:hypothetical protein